MNTQQGTITVNHVFQASAEDVFDAWLDPVAASKFLFATPSGEMVKAETDPRIGGRFNFTEQRDSVNVEHLGEYLEVERPTRLAFLFVVPLFSENATRVTIDIIPRDTGCELILTHYGVPESDEEKSVSGWSGILDNLDAQLSG